MTKKDGRASHVYLSLSIWHLSNLYKLKLSNRRKEVISFVGKAPPRRDMYDVIVFY